MFRTNLDTVPARALVRDKTCVQRLMGSNQRTRRRWEANIKMVHVDVWYEGVDSVHVLQSRDQWRAFVQTVMNLQVQKKKMYFSII
jgi:hypothetical protein